MLARPKQRLRTHKQEGKLSLEPPLNHPSGPNQRSGGPAGLPWAAQPTLPQVGLQSQPFPKRSSPARGCLQPGNVSAAALRCKLPHRESAQVHHHLTEPEPEAQAGHPAPRSHPPAVLQVPTGPAGRTQPSPPTCTSHPSGYSAYMGPHSRRTHKSCTSISSPNQPFPWDTLPTGSP